MTKDVEERSPTYSGCKWGVYWVRDEGAEDQLTAPSMDGDRMKERLQDFEDIEASGERVKAVVPIAMKQGGILEYGQHGRTGKKMKSVKQNVVDDMKAVKPCVCSRGSAEKILAHGHHQ